MFDTVQLVSPCLDLDLERLWRGGWRRETYERQDAEGMPREFRRFTLRRDSPPHFLRYSECQGLRVEASLPRLVYGDNISLLRPGDVDVALDELSNRISEMVGDIPHVREWAVRGRADAVFQWQTTWEGKEHTAEYLSAFKTRALAKHISQTIDREATLYWRNKIRVIRMYDKYRESRMETAKGLLRFEVQMNRPKAELRRLAGVTGPRAADALTWKSAAAVLTKYLAGLSADREIMAETLLAARLIREFGPAAGRRLLGTVRLLQLFSIDQLAQMGFDRTTLWRDLSRIKNTGLSNGINKWGRLPPLTLPEVYTGEPGSLCAL